MLGAKEAATRTSSFSSLLEMEKGGGGGGAGDERDDMGPQKLARTDTFPYRMGPTFCSDLYMSEAAAAAAARGRSTLSLQEPFAPSAFTSGVGMAASYRFPFTSSQWQELERQALIYKYMMASVPIPPHLLNLLLPRNLSEASLSHSVGRASSFNLRFSSNSDPEPGRCRRTDGKKWRCSRDVALEQKYCERHMHRGRPRSRKPVEVASIKERSAASATVKNVSSGNGNLLGVETAPASCSSQHHSGPYRNQISASSAALHREPRYMDWMSGETGGMSPDQPWQQQLMQSKVGSRDNSCNGGNSILQPHYQEPLNLNFSDFSNTASDSHQNSPSPSCLFLSSDLTSFEDPNQRDDSPRGFIDAWSVSTREPADSGDKNGGKSLMSSLTLSMPVCNEKDMNQIQMGLGISDPTDAKSHHWSSPLPWLTSSVGGPLGEVLRSGASAASDSRSRGKGFNLMGNCWMDGVSPPRVVSPSGVLQKALGSLSDSSGSSSPTLAAAKSEIALQWLSSHARSPS